MATPRLRRARLPLRSATFSDATGCEPPARLRCSPRVRRRASAVRPRPQRDRRIAEGASPSSVHLRQATSVTAGPLCRVELPLTAWFSAGLSSGHPFQRHFGPATPQPTRPRLLQVGVAPGRRTRRAMVAPDRSPLAGLAEVDERKSPCAPRMIRSPVVAGAAARAKCSSPVRSKSRTARPAAFVSPEITDFSAPLHGFIAANVAPGITIRTDGWSGYPGAPDVAHDPQVIGPIAAHVVLPSIHHVFSNLKTWALGVYHGLRKKHLQAYLDEFVFRFNRRRTRHAAFRALLGIGVAIKSATCKRLIQPDVGG